MAGQPPESKGKTPGKAEAGRRPPEFAPAGRRGDDSITRHLRKVYEEVAAEPVPPELMKLLDQLGEKRAEDDDV